MGSSVTYDIDEEDGQRGVKNHLQYRVDSYQNGTVLLIASSKACPYKDLDSISVLFYAGNTGLHLP